MLTTPLGFQTEALALPLTPVVFSHFVPLLLLVPLDLLIFKAPFGGHVSGTAHLFLKASLILDS